MRIAKERIDVRLEIPGATIRQQRGFGDVSGFGAISGEYFSLAAGVDTTPLFEGLEGDLCQCPHWGYVLSGRMTFEYPGGDEVYEAGDAFYSPPGHAPVKHDPGTEIVMFSPTHELRETEEVMQRNMRALQSG